MRGRCRERSVRSWSPGPHLKCLRGRPFGWYRVVPLAERRPPHRPSPTRSRSVALSPDDGLRACRGSSWATEEDPPQARPQAVTLPRWTAWGRPVSIGRQWFCEFPLRGVFPDTLGQPIFQVFGSERPHRSAGNTTDPRTVVESGRCGPGPPGLTYIAFAEDRSAGTALCPPPRGDRRTDPQLRL